MYNILEKGEEDVVTFKVECREVDEDLTSPKANRKGVFSSSWPYLNGIESFKKKMIVDRFSLSKITAMHYCDEFDVMCLNTDDDLRVCLGYFKGCFSTYRNWIGFCKIYVVATPSPDAHLKQPSPGQTDNKVTISMHISDLVNRILESFSTAILFQCMDLKLGRFAFRVHSKYGNNVIVINEDMAFCYACNKSITLNKSLQMVNVDEHVKRHKCCKENDLFGMHLWAMGTHVAKLKKDLLASFERISDRGDDEIQEPISELYSMPQDILSKVDGIIKLLSERPSADNEIFRELLGDVRKLVKPWNSYEELWKSADTQKRVEVVTSMENIGEASALLFFTTAADALSKDHVFYQETYSFLWESFNKGRLTNFCEKYKTLTKFQERLQFKFGSLAASS